MKSLDRKQLLLGGVLAVALSIPLTLATNFQRQNLEGRASVTTSVLAIDAHVSVNQTNQVASITSPNFSTRQAGELITVFLASDGPIGTQQEFTSVSAPGLPQFTLAKRANSQEGTSEVWYTYAENKLTNVKITATRKNGSYRGLIDVVTFTGAAKTVGATAAASAPNGAPSVNLITTVPNAMVWAVGNDWDQAKTRRVGANQKISRQFIDKTSGDTYWTQYQQSPFQYPGTMVTINDTAPTTNRWNLATIEVVPMQLATPTIVPVTRYSLWNNDSIPTNPTDSDTQATEIGVKFQSNVTGKILGIRYYKGATNTGTHIANLWSKTGTQLATATFANETEAGWQEVLFAQPVAIDANNTYVASYHTDSGHYAGDNNYFLGKGADNGPLHALADGVDGNNGVYKYGTSGFPTNSYQASNYWVDVIFETSTVVPTLQSQPTATSIVATPTVPSSVTTNPTVMPTTPPVVSGGKNCAANPSACGYPDKTNTGVPVGVSLTRVDGAVTLSTPGMVYSNKEVHGNIVVTANNVTIRNVKLLVSGSSYGISVLPWDNSSTGLVVEDSEIDFKGFDDGKGIAFNNYTAKRVYFHNGADCFHFGDNIAIEDSYCTAYPDNASASQITAFCERPSHIDGMQSDGGSNITLNHNTIFNQCGETSAILMSTNTSPISNVRITNNLMAGGGYTLYCNAGSKVSSEAVIGNRFSKLFFPNGGYWGPTTGCEDANVYSGNIWDDTLAPL